MTTEQLKTGRQTWQHCSTRGCDRRATQRGWLLGRTWLMCPRCANRERAAYDSAIGPSSQERAA